MLFLFIAQLALVVVISGAINRISATIALLLFFVYAASLGLVIGLIVDQYYATPRSSPRSSAPRRCSARRPSTAP